MTIQEATDAHSWDTFLGIQRFRPFLQSWTMGEVYRDTGQEPIRLEARENGEIIAICQAILVPARRGRHLSIPYGPVVNCQLSIVNCQHILDSLITELTNVARAHGCAFIRMSPFWVAGTPLPPGARPAPLHLLAEHLWYLPLVEPDPWNPNSPLPAGEGAGVRGETRHTEEQLLMGMRKTTRNLIRRAEKDGVTVEASQDPNRDIAHFLTLHEETRKRHGFTPYTDAFFRSQVKRFAQRGECTLYLARYQGDVAAASIHMHTFGETSYHHGASTHRPAPHPSGANGAGLAKVPASYLLQWTAIRDALRRGDHVYNFWGIAPNFGQRTSDSGQQNDSTPKSEVRSPKSDHPFAGVTLFKTGFGGKLLELVHCMDFPLSGRYHLTHAIELIRKWHRGF